MTKVQSYSLFTDFDISLFKAGKHYRLYEKFGSHLITVDGVEGTYLLFGHLLLKKFRLLEILTIGLMVSLN